MVEKSAPASPAPLRAPETGRVGGRRAVLLVAACVASTLALTTVMVLSPPRASSVPSSSPIPTRTAPTGAALVTTTAPPTSAPLPVISAGSTPTTTPTTVAPAPLPAPVTVVAAAQPVAVEPPIATLVAEVEAAGIEPGSNWSWSMGDTAAHCGPISGSGTGCTFGTGGLENTVFAGSPDLSLVAHELANAETQNDAVPDLLTEVAAAEGGSSWSPTDAVASCLVAHFMEIQDDAAGVWACPATTATFVADNIHDTLSTTVGAIPG
jgi:hypothetical protein